MKALWITLILFGGVYKDNIFENALFFTFQREKHEINK